MKVVLSPQASNDLKSIGRYTARKWNRRQAQTYLFKLRARFQWIAENPSLGRVRDDIALGYRYVREGSHLIVYEISDNQIQIIGLPHTSMDVVAHFDGDT